MGRKHKDRLGNGFPGKQLSEVEKRQQIESALRDISTFQALADHVLIRINLRKKTAGGIALPESAQQSGVVTGIVESIGPGAHTRDGSRITPDLKVGDVVFLNALMGEAAQFQIGDPKDPEAKFIICREAQIVGRMKSGETEGVFPAETAESVVR